MQVHPIPRVVHIVIASVCVMSLGTLAKLAPVVAFGGSLLLAVAYGRVRSWLSVSRLRRSGFEMIWTHTTRVVKVERAAEIVVSCEIRNRSRVISRCVRVRAVASSMLNVSIGRTELVLLPGAREPIEFRIRGDRVGRWGVHGLALEVRAGDALGDGMFEVPLFFANPLGVEVLPGPLSVFLSSAVGGRARRRANVGPRADPRSRGDADELRELRLHMPGDPWKRIAWKASAKRGVLLSREMERQDEDVVWLVLDASAELLRGEVGEAPLDVAIDRVASLALRTLSRGGSVGLVVVAGRLRAWVAPKEGALEAVRIAAALLGATSLVDADRSDLDDAEVARRVLEHLRPLDPEAAALRHTRKLSALVKRADAVRSRSPFAARPPYALAAEGQALRRYLAAFGIEVPPPSTRTERQIANVTMAMSIERIAKEKVRPSAIHVFGPAPLPDSQVAQAVAFAKRKRIDVRWTLPQPTVKTTPGEESIEGESMPDDDEPFTTLEDAVKHVVRMSEQASYKRGTRWMASHGVRDVRMQTRRRSS